LAALADRLEEAGRPAEAAQVRKRGFPTAPASDDVRARTLANLRDVEIALMSIWFDLASEAEAFADALPADLGETLVRVDGIKRAGREVIERLGGTILEESV
jgi:hypothetical protein